MLGIFLEFQNINNFLLRKNHRKALVVAGAVLLPNNIILKNLFVKKLNSADR